MQVYKVSWIASELSYKRRVSCPSFIQVKFLFIYLLLCSLNRWSRGRRFELDIAPRGLKTGRRRASIGG